MTATRGPAGPPEGGPAPAADAPEPAPHYVRLVHWIADLQMTLGCGPAADVPGARASSQIAEVTCAACHGEHLTQVIGGLLVSMLTGGAS